MIYQKVSLLTGKTNEMEIPLSPVEITEGLRNGKLIQDAFPFLTSTQREFLLNGTTEEEWNNLIGPEPEE